MTLPPEDQALQDELAAELEEEGPLPVVPVHRKVLNSINEAAVLWSISPRKMSDLIRDGIVPVIRIGRRVLIPRVELDAAWKKFEANR